MSPMTMAILALLAWKAVKHFGGSQPGAAPSPAPAPAPAPKPGKGPVPKGIPPHVLAAMGGVPLAPPPASAQTVARPQRAVRQDTGGLLAGPSPASRQTRKQIEQIRQQLAQLVKTCDTALQIVQPAIALVGQSSDVCAQEGFAPAAAQAFVEDLRATLDRHFPHTTPRA